MDGELERILKGLALAILGTVLVFAWRSEGKTWRISVRIASALDRIEIKYLPDMKIEYYDLD
jgi:hypothetical protein